MLLRVHSVLKHGRLIRELVNLDVSEILQLNGTAASRDQLVNVVIVAALNRRHLNRVRKLRVHSSERRNNLVDLVERKHRLQSSQIADSSGAAVVAVRKHPSDGNVAVQVEASREAVRSVWTVEIVRILDRKHALVVVLVRRRVQDVVVARTGSVDLELDIDLPAWNDGDQSAKDDEKKPSHLGNEQRHDQYEQAAQQRPIAVPVEKGHRTPDSSWRSSVVLNRLMEHKGIPIGSETSRWIWVVV